MRSHLIRCLWSALILFSPYMSHGQDSAPLTFPPKGPLEIKRPGEPWRLIWKDGREAQVKLKLSAIVRLSIPTVFTENTCVDSQNISPTVSCSFIVPVRSYGYGLYWTKHSDTTKIDQIVKTVSYNGQDTSEVSETNNTVGAWAYLSPQLDPLIEKTKLVCNDYSWAPGSVNGVAPAMLPISRWENQLMLPNPDSNESENRNIGGFVKGQFVSKEGHLMLDRAENINSVFSSLEFLQTLEDVAIYLPFPIYDDPTSRSCQLTSRINILEAKSEDGKTVFETIQNLANTFQNFESENIKHVALKNMITRYRSKSNSVDRFFLEKSYLLVSCKAGSISGKDCDINWETTQEVELR